MTKDVERPPTKEEWLVLSRAQRTAADWCGIVANRLEPVEHFLVSMATGGDPRLYDPHVRRMADLFEAHFKSRKPGDLREIREAFGMLKPFLHGLRSTSYRIVPDDVVDREADGDTYGFVRGGGQTIYIAQRFFDETGKIVARAKTARSEVTVGPRILTDAQKARLVVHEAAHACLRVLHSGGKLGFDRESCDTGYSVIKTYAQASKNAYCYDHFAFCLSR